MELTAGVHALPIDVAFGDHEMTLNPVAVETLGGLDVDHTHCFHGGDVEAGSERIADLLAGR